MIITINSLYWILGSIVAFVLISLIILTVIVTKMVIKECFSRVDFDYTDEERLARSGIIMSFFEGKETKEIFFRSFDDTLLHGYYVFNGKKNNKVVICHHGLHSDLMCMTPYANMYYQMGYDVVLIDSRNCGKSEGKYTTFGIKESLDLEKWIDQIVFMKGKDVEILLTGVSMGAATVIMTTQTESAKYIKAVVADCGFTDFHSQVEDILKKSIIKKEYLKKFAKLMVVLMHVGVRIYCRFNTLKSSPIKAIRNSNTPIFIVHGSNDSVVDVKMAYELYDACQSKKGLFIMEGAEHAQAINHDEESYFEHVNNFLKEIQ